MRSRVQVSLPLPTKNQALASTQVLFFYPFSGFITKFAPPLQRIAAASVHRVPPTHLQKNSKKSAVRLSPAPLREFLEEPLLGAFRRAFGAPLEELLGSLCEHLGGGPARSLCSAPSGELLGHLCGSLWEPLEGAPLGPLRAPLREPLEGAPLGPLRAPLRELLEESLFEAFWRVFGEPLRAPLRAQQKTRPRRTGSTHKH